MRAYADHRPEDDTPPGVHRIEDTARGGLHVFDVKVRCRRQAADEPPMFARSRFAWKMGEVSGSLGDLGTFLPHIVGAITVVGMDPTGILTLGGLLLFSGIELALSAKLQEYEGDNLFLVLLMASIGVALNPAAAFAVGLPISYGFKRSWISLHKS